MTRAWRPVNGANAAVAARPATFLRSECDAVSAALAATAGTEAALGRVERDHLAGCLRCRVEQVRYGKLIEALRSLREFAVAPDASLEAQILMHLDRYLGRRDSHARSRVAAAVGGLAGAAATAGVIALTMRHRRGTRLAS